MEPKQRIRLVWYLRNLETSKDHTLNDNINKIGRSAEQCEIVLAEDRIKNVHCKMEYIHADKKYKLTDCVSIF